MVKLEELWDIDYGDVGENTKAYGSKLNPYNPLVKIQYTKSKRGVKIDDMKVVEPSKRGQGLGTQAIKLFEKSLPKNTVVFGTAGFKDWSPKFNRLARKFWEKMGYTFSAKSSGKPARGKKKLK